MRLRRCVTVMAASAAVLSMASPAQAAWHPEEQVNSDDPTVTDIGAALVETADDGSAVAVWVEWHGDDARLMASRRAISGGWGSAQLVDDLTEREGSDPRVGLTGLVVLPDRSAVIAYEEYDVDAGVDFLGRVATLHPGGSITPELNGSEAAWQLVADADGDWLATAREYDHCACEYATWYSDGGSAPEQLGTYVGFGLRFALSRDELVYYAVYDPDGLYQPAHTLRVQRIDAAAGTEKTVVLLKPHGAVSGLDLDADISDDVHLVWSVRHAERSRPDVVLAAHRTRGGAWRRPHEVADSGGDGNRPIGAPQVETDGAGRALVTWTSPEDSAGTVDLDSAVVRPARQSTPVRRLVGDLDPGTGSLAFVSRVNEAGQAAVSYRHLAPCPGAPASTCTTVSAVRGMVGRLRDPVDLFAAEPGYETVSMALSDEGTALVLAVEQGSTDIETRTSP